MTWVSAQAVLKNVRVAADAIVVNNQDGLNRFMMLALSFSL
jgi:hypothetical protein